MTTPAQPQEPSPCPFCGAEAHIKDTDDAILVYCPTRSCVGPCAAAYSKSEAIAAWNTRADTAALRQQVAQLEQERDSLRAQLEAQGQWEDIDVYRLQISLNRGMDKPRLVINCAISGHLIMMEDSEGNRMSVYLPIDVRLQQRRTVGEGEGQP